MKMKYMISLLLILILPLLSAAQNRPFRVGTTTADLLEIGFGSAATAMGDAYVAMSDNSSGLYWNPAGLAYLTQNEAQFSVQPWVADINMSFSSVGVVIPDIGVIGLGLIYGDYGQMDVTTVNFQEGTGEQFSANTYALSLAFARKLTDWFAFGLSGKYVGMNIWHMSANALALDLGVKINTRFFSPDGKRENGLRIGMSISNYGTRMKFDGLDLTYPIDILPDQSGNFANTPGQFQLQGWELPLMFRLGVALTVIKTENQQLAIAVDALHPNNNAESINIGGEYAYNAPGMGKFFLRGGYKGLFLTDSQYGLALGAGVEKYILGNVALRFDYVYRDMGLLGKVNAYTLGFRF